LIFITVKPVKTGLNTGKQAVQWRILLVFVAVPVCALSGDRLHVVLLAPGMASRWWQDNHAGYP
jgi:hypothetical protein